MFRLLVIALVVVSVLCTSIEASAAKPSCTPPGVDLGTRKPAAFSDEQLAEMENGYSTPQVRGLRAAIDSYLADNASAMTAGNLHLTDRQLLRTRFFVMSDDAGEFGGTFLHIFFKNRVDVLFLAWVYPLSSGPFELRTWQRIMCS